MLNPVAPGRGADEGDEVLLDLYRSKYSDLIAMVRARAYWCAAANAEREGYAEIKPTLEAMSKRAQRDRDRIQRYAMGLHRDADNDRRAEILALGVTGLACNDFRAAMGLEEPTLPNVVSVRRAANALGREVYQAAY